MQAGSYTSRRAFHDYFVTHLPSSSLHPDSRSLGKLPRDQAAPHPPDAPGQPVTFQQTGRGASHVSRDLTVVRIPLKGAKHHYGVSCVRGTRPYNEDAYQAGTVEMPAFAKRRPMSLTDDRKSAGEGISADSKAGDPQIFYFGVFDGHGGDTCSHFLRDKLHAYVEDAATRFGLRSTLSPKDDQTSNSNPEQLQQNLVREWKDTVGGYFRRFKPDHFSEHSGGKGMLLTPSVIKNDRIDDASRASDKTRDTTASIEQVLTYTFLQADLDFVKTQAGSEALSLKEAGDGPLDDNDEILGRHSHHSNPSFLGGSTCSIALVSTPNATPFWNPSSHLSVLTAHIGDTRILLCDSQTGVAVSLTDEHHPSDPGEAARLRRYAQTFTTDSFGEERMVGLANTRAFGDVRSKRIGVSAEPQLRLLHLAPASHSFMILISDGVTASLSDQEIVDVVKEAKTPDQGARDVVALATELSEGEKGQADNATAMVVRLGGWERRSEGGVGSLGTKEQREYRKKEASQGRGRRT